MTQTIKITGMHCGNCAKAVERALRAVPGVSAACVCVAEGKADVQGTCLDRAALAAAVEDAGFEVVPE